MKRKLFIYQRMVVTVLLTTFMSCSKDYDIATLGKLLDTATSATSVSYGDYTKYEFDGKNRLKEYKQYTKTDSLLNTTTLTYSGDDLVKQVYLNSSNSGYVYEYRKSGNSIIEEYKTITNGNSSAEATIYTSDLNSNGMIVKREYSTASYRYVTLYEYNNGNRVKIVNETTQLSTGTVSESSTEYKFDNKKSIHYHCKTPKWFWGANMNNAIEQLSTAGSFYQYDIEYDSDGFPARITTKDKSGSITGTTEYKYK